MNINDFENLIDPKILDRGFDYYEYDQVMEVDVVGIGEYSAKVRGSITYSIFIGLNGQFDVIEHICSCPFDWGPYCKHKVAVLYYIRDCELYKEAPLEIGQVDPIHNALQKHDKKKLVELILYLVRRNTFFRSAVAAYLGLEDDSD